MNSKIETFTNTIQTDTSKQRFQQFIGVCKMNGLQDVELGMHNNYITFFANGMYCRVNHQSNKLDCSIHAVFEIKLPDQYGANKLRLVLELLNQYTTKKNDIDFELTSNRLKVYLSM